jgi:tetratricopeptide (TPR) repeat protein
VSLFPHAVVAHNGRAEVLKAMGRFDDALIAFDKTVSLFPHAVAAHTGRAEILKAMGRFDDALIAYDKTVSLFPHAVVAHNGRAEVLKAMGRLDDALAVFAQIRKLFPDDQYTVCGYASVLLLMNHLDAIRDIVTPRVAPVSRADWVLYHIAAMMHLKSDIETGSDEAIRRLSFGTQHAPWQDQRRYFASALAVARIKRKEYREALQILQPELKLLEMPERQKRLVLIGHSHAAIGERQEAINSLNTLKEAKDPNVISLSRLLWQRYSLGTRDKQKPPSNPVDLDSQIAQKEFILAMAA